MRYAWSLASFQVETKIANIRVLQMRGRDEMRGAVCPRGNRVVESVAGSQPCAREPTDGVAQKASEASEAGNGGHGPEKGHGKLSAQPHKG